MLIIDQTSADYIDDDDDLFRGVGGGVGGRGGGGNVARKKKAGGKGGKGKRGDGEKGKKKGEKGEEKGGGKKKKGGGGGADTDDEDGKGKKGKKGKGGKDDKRDNKKGKKSEGGGGDKEGGGKGGKGRRTPLDDSAVAADERRTREEEERKRREAEDREEEKERQKRAREMKMALEAELAAEREREAAEAKAGGVGGEDGGSSAGDRRTNRKNRPYANEDEAFEAEMNALRRKAKMDGGGGRGGSGGGRSDVSRLSSSSSSAEGRLAGESRAELEERRRREADERLTWMTSHLGLSRHSCRFELPMDMRLLETMSPREYLSKYCVVSSKRMLLYKRVFGKFVSKTKTPELEYRNVAAALREVHIHGITEDQMKAIMRLVDIDQVEEEEEEEAAMLVDKGDERIATNKNNNNNYVDLNLFAGIAALTERMLYPLFSNTSKIPPRQLEEAKEPSEEDLLSSFATKEKLENADFFCMPWKFEGVNVNPTVKKLLEVL